MTSTLTTLLLAGLTFSTAFGEEPKTPAAEPALKPQTTCPIMAGSAIDKDLYVDVNGKRIYVCCKGCIEPIRKDPQAALAALAKAGQAAEDTPIVQATCPITGGAIDRTQFVEQDGRRIYVCCKGCLDPVKKDFAANLKKVDEEIAKINAAPKKEEPKKEEPKK